MPFRRRTVRRQRRRTRWVAINAGARSYTATGGAFNELIFSDASGLITTADLIGSTITKVILDVSQNMVPFPPDPVLEQRLSGTVYFGLFVTQDDTPSTLIWTPNTPHGDFMLRETSAFWWYRMPETQNSNLGGEAFSNYPHLRMETHVGRKIRENSRLWLATSFAIADDTDLSTYDIGWTGRALITLP